MTRTSRARNYLIADTSQRSFNIKMATVPGPGALCHFKSPIMPLHLTPELLSTIQVIAPVRPSRCRVPQAMQGRVTASAPGHGTDIRKE